MDKTLSKLNRIEGQLQGIKKMYQEDRTCSDIVQQIIAVRSALASVGKDLLKGEASRCAKAKSQEDFDRILKSLFDLQ